MSKNAVIWIIILAAGAGLLISANAFRDTYPGPVTDNSRTTAGPTESSEPQTTPRPNPKPSPSLSVAACQLSGEIFFLNKNTYENKGAKIVYQNVDDEIRQIFWKSNPDDGALTVGPNLFEDLFIPNGERDIGVAFAKEPAYKNYSLTASITYGIKNANDIFEERIADCTGTIKVTTP